MPDSSKNCFLNLKTYTSRGRQELVETMDKKNMIVPVLHQK
jgi:hypothetical protein